MFNYSKKISVIIAIFILIFVISIVYAASAGVLGISGTATFSSQADVDLSIVDADFSNLTPANSVNPAVQDEFVIVPGLLEAGDSKTMYIFVDLIFPGDKRIIEFYIENLETVSTKLGPLMKNDPDINSTGVSITWPNLEDIVILSGQKSGPYQIEIEWDIAHYNISNTGQRNFSATITYKQGT